MIGAVIPNTPAEEAGLLRGDRILAVDGKTTEGETVDQTVARVRGPEGQPVTLTVGRTGREDFDVTIVRRKFDLPLVSWAMVPGRKVAMIRLEQFATGATKGLQDAITKAKAAGATALIFDLRFNGGGYVPEAVGVASEFLPDGIVFQSLDRSGKQEDAAVKPGGLATDIPLVVLADGDTASAAEIVTGAIQDAKRGTVVGVKTFGTGTVLQALRPRRRVRAPDRRGTLAHPQRTADLARGPGPGREGGAAHGRDPRPAGAAGPVPAARHDGRAAGGLGGHPAAQGAGAAQG